MQTHSYNPVVILLLPAVSEIHLDHNKPGKAQQKHIYRGAYVIISHVYGFVSK